MRFLTTLAFVLSLLAMPAAASACGMEIDFDRKHTLMAKKATDADAAEKASVLKALLAEVDAKMEAEVVTEPTVIAAPPTAAPTAAAIAATNAASTEADSAEAPAATYPSGFPTVKVAKR